VVAFSFLQVDKVQLKEFSLLQQEPKARPEAVQLPNQTGLRFAYGIRTSRDCGHVNYRNAGTGLL
jgi:hypothetical protein